MPFTNFPNGLTSFGIPLVGGGGAGAFGIPTSRGTYRMVGTPTSPYGSVVAEAQYSTIQAAINAAADGDVIMIAQGTYDEAVTIGAGLDEITLVGMGGAGAVAIEPTATNAVGLTISGTATRTSGVQLINVGCAGDGTGGGLLVQGNIRRFRAYGCKFESAAFAAKLLSNATGSVSDTRFIGCEFAWSAIGLDLEVEGGGDPVTQTLVQGCLFQNITADGVLVGAVHSADLWLMGNIFANQEDASEPTDYLDIDTASTTGFCAYNVFANPTNDQADIKIAAGVIWGPNGTEAGWSTARPA